MERETEGVGDGLYDMIPGGEGFFRQYISLSFAYDWYIWPV